MLINICWKSASSGSSISNPWPVEVGGRGSCKPVGADAGAGPLRALLAASTWVEEQSPWEHWDPAPTWGSLLPSTISAPWGGVLSLVMEIPNFTAWAPPDIFWPLPSAGRLSAAEEESSGRRVGAGTVSFLGGTTGLFGGTGGGMPLPGGIGFLAWEGKDSGVWDWGTVVGRLALVVTWNVTFPPCVVVKTFVPGDADKLTRGVTWTTCACCWPLFSNAAAATWWEIQTQNMVHGTSMSRTYQMQLKNITSINYGLSKQ